MDILDSATLATLVALGCIVALNWIFARARARSEYDTMINDRIADWAGVNRELGQARP